MKLTRSYLATLLIGIACGCAGERPRAAPGPEQPSERDTPIAVEVFDPDPVVVERLTAHHGQALHDLERHHAEAQIDAVIDAIRRDGIYAFVEPALTTYYNPRAEYLTIDVVPLAEAAERMPFKPVPSGTYPDPGGLLAAWHAFESQVFKLLDRGESVKATRCPVFHCLADLQHPGLRAFADPLQGARDHITELVTILRDDREVSHRAAAAYLLAYAADGAFVVTTLESAISDPSALVRNNVMRVLAEIARTHPEIEIPIAPILVALKYPATTDRNKAAAILTHLLTRPRARALYSRVVREAGSTLLAMLRLRQPNNHDLAYEVLTIISGRSFSDRDLTAWRAWVEQSLGRASAGPG